MGVLCLTDGQNRTPVLMVQYVKQLKLPPLLKSMQLRQLFYAEPGKLWIGLTPLLTLVSWSDVLLHASVACMQSCM
jgi:hypothetical protein